MNTIIKYFVFISIILISLTACVSKQKYLKTETDLKACTERESILNEREKNTNEQKVSLNKRIEFLKKQQQLLEDDTTALASRIRQYELKIVKYNQIISSSISDKEKQNLLLKLMNDNK
jgi:hypothetical protein